MPATLPSETTTPPDSFPGHFGRYGGVFVPETLMTALAELGEVYASARNDPAFEQELTGHLKEFAGRPTELYFARRLTEHCGGARIYLKRNYSPHGRAQDQQCVGAGAARPSHGQETHHGDGRRPAWCRHGGGLRQVRPGMCRLHGCRRHGAAGAQCLSHAPDGNGGSWRRGGTRKR